MTAENCELDILTMVFLHRGLSYLLGENWALPASKDEAGATLHVLNTVWK